MICTVRLPVLPSKRPPFFDPHPPDIPALQLLGMLEEGILSLQSCTLSRQYQIQTDRMFRTEPNSRTLFEIIFLNGPTAACRAAAGGPWRNGFDSLRLR